MTSQDVLAAITLLKDWSNILLVVQTGALGVIGSLLKDTHSPKGRLFAFLSIFCFVLSICAAANLLGSLPYLAQRAATIHNIYREQGNLNVVIADSATAQSVFFIMGLVAFALFAFARGDVAADRSRTR